MKYVKKGIPRLLEISGEKKWPLLLSAIFASLSAVLQIVPYIAAFMIIRIFLKSENVGEIQFWGMIALVGVLLSMFFNGLSFVLSHFAAFRIIYNLRLKLASHLASLPLGFYTKTSTGEIHKTICENTDLIELFISHKIPDVIMSVSGAVAVFSLYMYVDWRLGLVTIITYVTAMYIQFRMYGKAGVKEEVKKYGESMEKINASAMELAKGLPVLKMFGHTSHFFIPFKNSVLAYKKFALNFAEAGRRDFIIYSLLVNFFIFFIYPIVVSIYLISPSDHEILITAVFFTILSNALLPQLMSLTDASGTIMIISEGVARIDELFRQKPLSYPEVTNKPSSSEIEFRNVSYKVNDNEVNVCEFNNSEVKVGEVNIKKDVSNFDSGTNAERTILHNVSFKVKEGECLAITGRSGSGKSTILNLLARFYDVNEGQILIGGVDVREIAEEDLMSNVSIVLQKTFMFNASIRDNIIAGCTNVSEEDIMQAVHLARCDDIIQKYGLDCIIGSHGTDLSGGEKQRLNIARAILKNAPILLLDEITSSLDPENEYLLHEAINSLKKNKTVIKVAHRLGSITDADKIILMEKGQIMAEGTHKELLINSPNYQELWQLYSKTGEWKLNNNRSYEK